MTVPAGCGPITLAFCQYVQARASDQPESFFQPRIWAIRRPEPEADDPAGCVDFSPVLAEAARQGYQGWLVIEAKQDPLKADPLACQMMGLACLKHFAARAGHS